MAINTCPRCGKTLSNDAVYCPHCFTTIEEEKEIISDSAMQEDLFAEIDSLMDELSMQDDPKDFDTFVDSAYNSTNPFAEISDDNDLNTYRYDEVDENEYVHADDETSVVSLDDEVLSPKTECERLYSGQLHDVPEQNDKHKKKSSKSTLWLILSIVAIVLIVVFILLFIIDRPANPVETPEESQETSVTTVTTQVPRDPKRDAWLQSFKGQWVDEHSVGKGDLQKQGGYSLMINDIVEDIILFELYSYSGPDNYQTASVTGIQAVMEEDTLHFEFEDDGLGHAGEGFLQFHDEGINLEVIIDPVPETYSLALNAVFLRPTLPSSEGLDIRVITDTASLVSLGETIAEPTDNEDNTTTHTYTGVKVISDDENKVRSITVDYTALEDDTLYCYECVDGSMTYDIIKEYYGEAEQDYEEIDSQILVLHYPLSEKSSLTFTFDSTSKLLQKIEFVLS